MVARDWGGEGEMLVEGYRLSATSSEDPRHSVVSIASNTVFDT